MEKNSVDADFNENLKSKIRRIDEKLVEIIKKIKNFKYIYI